MTVDKAALADYGDKFNSAIGIIDTKSAITYFGAPILAMMETVRLK